MAGMKISGEYITKRARDMFWKDKRTYKDVSSFLIGLLGEQFKEHVTPLLSGYKKLEGDNELELIDDGSLIKVISDIAICKREADQKEAVKNHMQWNIRNYIDFFAMDKSWTFFVGCTPKQAYEYAYTQPEDIARVARNSGIFFIDGKAHINEPLDLSYYSDDSEKDFLDHGAYLVKDPELVYRLMGQPVYEGNMTVFYERLYEYWNNSPMKNHPAVKRRQRAWICNKFTFENHLKQKGSISTSRQEYVQKEEEIRGSITSKYGIIAPSGEWFNVSWGYHSLIAKEALAYDGYDVDDKQLDELLDMAIELGYILIRDPLNVEPYVYGVRPNMAQEDKIRQYCNKWGIRNIRREKISNIGLM